LDKDAHAFSTKKRREKSKFHLGLLPFPGRGVDSLGMGTYSQFWKDKIVRWIEWGIGRPLASGSARSFAKSVGWIGISFLIARVISSFVPLFAARALGKECFGQASLAITVGQFLQTVMLFGMNSAVVRFAAPKNCPREEVGSALIITLAATALTTAWLFVWGKPLLISSFRLSADIVNSGFLFGVLCVAYVFATSILQGLHRFFERGVAEILAAAFSIVGLAGAYWVLGKNFNTYVIAVCVGFLVAVVYSTHRSFSWMGVPILPTRKLLNHMTAYGAFSCLGNIGFILTFYFQPLLLNRLLSESEVGIFRVYQTASITVAQSLAIIFNTVFFPKASASRNRGELWKIIWRLWGFAAFPMALAFIASQLVLIPIAGRDYPMETSLIVLFAITALVITLQSTIGQFLAAEGVAGVGIGLVVSAVTGMSCLLATNLLVPVMHIAGACLALLFSYCIGLVLAWIAEVYLLRRSVLQSNVMREKAPSDDSETDWEAPPPNL